MCQILSGEAPGKELYMGQFPWSAIPCRWRVSTGGVSAAWRGWCDRLSGSLEPRLTPVKCSLYVMLLASVTAVCWARDHAQVPRLPSDLTELPLEELMNLEVTLVARKEQRLFEAPSAIYVITQEDIRRSGATSIPELLRLVPGMEVARIDASKWAISARGFNEQFANKLLVLMDGRSVYTPLFAGVYWDGQDTLLEDLERIEVIRGPAGTLWGANAVNGVINIVTKPGRDTQGGLVSAGGGTEERGFGGARYGGKIGDAAFYRAYIKYVKRDNAVTAFDTEAADAWRVVRGGFRLDWDVGRRDVLTLQGDIYDGSAGQRVLLRSFSAPFVQPLDEDASIAGRNMLARWEHTFSPRSKIRLHSYYDRTERQNALFRETRDTFDVDFQHSLAVGERHALVWGMGYRLTTDVLPATSVASFEPDRRSLHLLSAFVQDEITLIRDQLRLTLGSKFEHNDFTGFEVQPSGRLLWMPHRRHVVWTAVSRAVRTPARFEHDLRLELAVVPVNGLLNLVTVSGDPDFASEELMAYELGYRLQPINRLFLDLTTFYNSYKNLRTVEPGVPFVSLRPPAALISPARFGNRLRGETYGVEVIAQGSLTPGWRLTAGYTWLHIQLHRDASSGDLMTEAAAGDDPAHQFHVRSYLDLPWKFECDTALYYVDHLVAPRVPSYIRVDLRLGWRPTRALDLSLVGQNVFDARHLEFGPGGGVISQTAVQRGVYGKLTWRF